MWYVKFLSRLSRSREAQIGVAFVLSEIAIIFSKNTMCVYFTNPDTNGNRKHIAETGEPATRCVISSSAGWERPYQTAAVLVCFLHSLAKRSHNTFPTEMSMGLIEISYESSFPASRRASLFPCALLPGKWRRCSSLEICWAKTSLQGRGDSKDQLVQPQMAPVWNRVLRVSVKDS